MPTPASAPEPSQALRTIQAAVDKLQPGDTCLVRGGTYRETVVFPRSGQAGRPIAIKPFQDEKPVITGCDPVTGWTRHQGKIWKAPMPWTLGLGRNQVFAAGAVMIEARHPNDPAPGLEMYVSDLSPLWPTFGEFSISDPAEHPDRLVSELLQGQPADHWKGAVYYGVHYQGWCGQTGVIESSRSGEITVADRTRGWWFPLRSSSGHYANEEGRGMIVGHINALDRPGEWHWQDNTLYFIPQDDIEPGAVEAKSRQLAFDLSGRSQIQITGIAITAASARLDGSSHCTLEGCDFSYISHYVRHYGIGQIEHGRDTVKSGETGIFIGGHDNSFLNCSLRFSAGTGFHVRGYHHTIHNCLIDEVSYTSHYLNAITDAVSDYNDYENFLVGGHTITYNTMRNAGRHFFNFYGNGTSLASRDRRPMDYMATLFAHNHLYNGMLQTRDAGFLSGYHSSGGTLNDLNSNVCYNVLHDCYDISAMRWNVLGMIYLDLGTCDVDVHHNLLWASPGSHQHGIWFNTCCVDIHEHDNVLHREFIHNSAGLKPRDFPQGKPFAFGHDFEYPPALPKWPQLDRRRLQAEACSSHSAGVGKSSTGISGLNDGDWFAFDRIDLGAGWQSAVLRLACGAKEANTNRSARAAPRHQKATDTLVLESTRNDGTAEGVRNQWTFLHSLDEGAWVRFNQVPLGDGYRRFRIIYGNDSHTPGRIEVRLDSFDGPLVGEAALPKTDRHRGGHVQIYAETIAQLSADAAGTRDVFLVFRSDGGEPRVGFEYLGFEQYRGAIPLQKNEIKLELRAGGKDGRKIGEFYPRFTGGEDAYREFVAKLEPAQDAGPLFLVVRSALAQPLGAVDWLSLEKSAQSVDTNGLGAPPRTDEQGGLVFPQPTNRPRSRPNDHYVSQRAAESSASRPFFTATRLATPAVVDGKLNEWRDAPKSMPLSQSIKGAASSELSSTAWIGYDDEAFYVAAEHPDKDPADAAREHAPLGANPRYGDRVSGGRPRGGTASEFERFHRRLFRVGRDGRHAPGPARTTHPGRELSNQRRAGRMVLRVADSFCRLRFHAPYRARVPL